MKAVVFHRPGHIQVDQVPDPTIERDEDIIVRVTSTAICGSDLHLYELFGPFIDPGDVLGLSGHEGRS